MLASSSGVSSERSAFMGLVRNEIERLNQEISARGALTMIFKRGNIKARPHRRTLLQRRAAVGLFQFPLIHMAGQVHNGRSPALFGGRKCRRHATTELQSQPSSPKYGALTVA